VPASEIVHDIMIPLYHPLVGVSPLHACGSPAMLGSHIQRTSARFFENGARPSGILSAPGKINTDTAKRLKEAGRRTTAARMPASSQCLATG
jgi:phage portal protein BeeE